MGLVYHKKLGEDTEFALWRIEETADELLGKLQLKAHEESYLNGIQNGKRHLHWLSTRVLLRQLLNTTEYIDCQVDEHGKPYLTNFPHHISLSHSFDYAAVMISRTKAVGIDIEMVKTKIERIAAKFLSEQELAFIEPQKAIKHLYSCWCVKEALYKLQGKTNVSFKDDIHIAPFNFTEEEGSTSVHLNAGINKDYQVNYFQFENYMIGYVATEEDHEK